MTTHIGILDLCKMDKYKDEKTFINQLFVYLDVEAIDKEHFLPFSNVPIMLVENLPLASFHSLPLITAFFNSFGKVKLISGVSRSSPDRETPVSLRVEYQSFFYMELSFSLALKLFPCIRCSFLTQFTNGNGNAASAFQKMTYKDSNPFIKYSANFEKIRIKEGYGNLVFRKNRRDSAISDLSQSNEQPITPIVSRISQKIDNQVLVEIENGIEKRGTVMIRNIPNKYEPCMLQDYMNQIVFGLYDFLYLRMDFKNNCNVGYAFINFPDPLSILLLSKQVGKKWPSFNSDKKLGVSFASIQGRDKLIKKFQNSSVMLCDEPTWRPRLFYCSGSKKGQEEPFPTPPDGIYRPKSDVLFCRTP